MATINNQRRGQLSEQYAQQYLEQHGLTLVEKNYHFELGSHIRGEIDLIMRDKDYLVFVEVRFRLKDTFGNSLETINRKKQRTLIRAASYYLTENNLYDKVACRFDCIGINQQQEIIWIIDAFQV